VRTMTCSSVVALGLVLAGCTATPGTPPSTSVAISSEQIAALEDGTITWDEYEQGFNDYRSCLRDAGYELVEPHRERDVFAAGVPDAAVASGVNDTCYAFTWEQVDVAWQLAHEDSSETAEIVASCLRSKGIEPRPKYKDNLRLMEEHRLAIDNFPVGSAAR
jgi:hypothetical protein